MNNGNLFCHGCGADLSGSDFDEAGTITCVCGAASKASQSAMILKRARVKFMNRADCCKDEANLSPRDGGVVKCSVCGARNMASCNE